MLWQLLGRERVEFMNAGNHSIVKEKLSLFLNREAVCLAKEQVSRANIR